MNEFRRHWALDPAIAYLNHGAFGACPSEVIRYQREIQDEMEREAVQFMLRRLEPLLDESRAALGSFVGASPEDLAFVPNATTGVNAVLRSLAFREGDELLTTSQEYNACANALRFVAERSGARVVIADVPFPIASSDVVLERVMEKVSERTRLVLLDHVTSPVGIILPIEQLARELNGRGIETLIDGAHAPGMLPLNLEAIGATYYTANCHKWICAPKGAGFLWVRRDRQAEIRPTTISHGANSPRTDRSRFHIEFDWCGTQDFSPFIAVKRALEFIASLVPGGWAEVMRRNHELVLIGRKKLCEVLGIEAPAPESMLGSVAAVPLPDSQTSTKWTWPYFEPRQDELFFQHRVEVPLFAFPAPPKRLLRISAQLYNEEREYERLAEGLRAALARGL